MRVLLFFVLFATVSPAVHAQDRAVQVSAEGVMLDFQDADLRLVLAALAEAGGLNVLYGDLPERRVTLRTNRPVPADGILPLLRNVAMANGLLIIEEGDFVRLESIGGLRDMAARTDTAAQQNQELRLFIYRLNHARAAQVAATLQALFGGGQGGARSTRSLSRPSLGESLRSQAIPRADTQATPGDVEVVDELPGLRAELSGSLHIVPDEATNTLLVRAQAADWAIIEQAIQVVDLRPLQVVIEVVIAEVRRTRAISTGVSFSASREQDSELIEGELSSASSDNDAILRLVRTGSVNVEAALSALSSTGQVRILSRPVIHAQNSKEATILVGAERPFVQVFRSLPTDAAVRDQVVQYRDVATSLTILPTINTDGYVNLQLSQEVNNATSELQFGAPIISTRKATTHLLARDGQTLVIGGLIDRQTDRSRTGIPILSDIPLIGGLFGSTRDDEATSELFLFLTPHIVTNDADAERLRDEIERGTPLLNDLGPIQPIIPPSARPDTIPPS